MIKFAYSQVETDFLAKLEGSKVALTLKIQVLCIIQNRQIESKSNEIRSSSSVEKQISRARRADTRALEVALGLQSSGARMLNFEKKLPKP
jgi:hypothetical protein